MQSETSHPHDIVDEIGDDAIGIPEAAMIAARSTSWVRTHRAFGPLVPMLKGGRHAVSRTSLMAMLADRRAAEAARCRPPAPPRRAPLRLVWINPDR